MPLIQLNDHHARDNEDLRRAGLFRERAHKALGIIVIDDDELIDGPSNADLGPSTGRKRRRHSDDLSSDIVSLCSSIVVILYQFLKAPPSSKRRHQSFTSRIDRLERNLRFSELKNRELQQLLDEQKT